MGSIMCGGVGAGGGPAGPAAAGGRTRPKAAEPAPAGAGCPAGHRVRLLQGRPRRVVEWDHIICWTRSSGGTADCRAR